MVNHQLSGWGCPYSLSNHYHELAVHDLNGQTSTPQYHDLPKIAQRLVAPLVFCHAMHD
ncbi:MAG: hypothetical protein U1E98_06075 [Moraxella osloensis]